MNIFEQLNTKSKDNRFEGILIKESPQQSTLQNNFSTDNIFHQINNEQKNETKYSFLETARDDGGQFADGVAIVFEDISAHAGICQCFDERGLGMHGDDQNVNVRFVCQDLWNIVQELVS